MSSLLVVIGGASPDRPMRWMRMASGSRTVVGGGELGSGARAPAAAATDTVLVLPGSEAQVRLLDQVVHSEAQARAAAVFLFERALASDIEEAVYAVGAPAASGKRLAAAFDRTRLRHWMARCTEFGVSPGTIHLDCTLWPTQEGAVDLVEYDGRTIVAGGAAGGFAIESQLAPALVGPWLERLPRRPAVVQVIGVDGASDALLGAVPQAVRAPDADVPATLAAAALRPSAIAPVLRPSDIAGGKPAAAIGRAWGFAALLAVLAILIQAGVALLDGMRDADAARKFQAIAERQFLEIRPDVKRVVNLRAQVSAALNLARPRAANPVIALSKTIAGALQAHPEVRLEEMRYDTSERRVSVRLSAALQAPLDEAVKDLRGRVRDLQVGAMEVVAARVNVTVGMEAS